MASKLCKSRSVYIESTCLIRTAQKHLFQLLRAIGPTKIAKLTHYRTFFFPLSIGPQIGDSIWTGTLYIGGQVMKAGKYMEITEHYEVDALMDFLMVHVKTSAEP